MGEEPSMYRNSSGQAQFRLKQNQGLFYRRKS